MWKYSRRSYEPEIIIECDCIFHRYKTVYICGCGKLVSHSQSDWNEHRLHPNGINISSEYYWHEDTVLTLWDRLQAYGLLPYDDNNYSSICTIIGELQCR